MAHTADADYLSAMTQRPTILEDRVVLSVDGPDAEEFLNGLITNSSLEMQAGDARYGALLTPQGKLISDLIYLRKPDGFLLDVPIQADEVLLKRLKMFKLRANVDLALREELSVVAFADDDEDNAYADPRSRRLPHRAIREPEKTDAKSLHAWHAARIAACVPQQGYDFGENEVFPADINMDLNNGVDFQKGCFVGQEVVSRMKRRGTARRRTLTFEFERTAPERGADMWAGDAKIGAITSSSGNLALARVRLDRMAKATAEFGEAFSADDRNASLIRPDWLDAETTALTGNDKD